MTSAMPKASAARTAAKMEMDSDDDVDSSASKQTLLAAKEEPEADASSQTLPENDDAPSRPEDDAASSQTPDDAETPAIRFPTPPNVPPPPHWRRKRELPPAPKAVYAPPPLPPPPPPHHQRSVCSKPKARLARAVPVLVAARAATASGTARLQAQSHRAQLLSGCFVSTSQSLATRRTINKPGSRGSVRNTGSRLRKSWMTTRTRCCFLRSGEKTSTKG